MELLLKQYELIKGSRQAMLSFIEKEAEDQLTTPIPEFNNSNIRYLLVHFANTYKHWLANFAMDRKLPYADEHNITAIKEILALFEEVNSLVADFLKHFDNVDMSVTGTTRSCVTLTVTVLELFTHTITHEFHHKGQVMTMCRLLGHTPADTDVIRF